MKPLIVLILVFIISLATTYFAQPKAAVELSGRIAMSVMLFFTSIGHFKFKNGMAMMMPSFIPAKKLLVMSTGIIEILAGIGLLIPSTIKITGILLIVFFVLILPANIYAAINKIDYEKGDYNGKGAGYLWFRVPLQIFFIVWTWVFVLK